MAKKKKKTIIIIFFRSIFRSFSPFPYLHSNAAAAVVRSSPGKERRPKGRKKTFRSIESLLAFSAFRRISSMCASKQEGTRDPFTSSEFSVGGFSKRCRNDSAKTKTFGEKNRTKTSPRRTNEPGLRKASQLKKIEYPLDNTFGVERVTNSFFSLF